MCSCCKSVHKLSFQILHCSGCWGIQNHIGNDAHVFYCLHFLWCLVSRLHSTCIFVCVGDADALLFSIPSCVVYSTGQPKFALVLPRKQVWLKWKQHNVQNGLNLWLITFSAIWSSNISWNGRQYTTASSVAVNCKPEDVITANTFANVYMVFCKGNSCLSNADKVPFS